MKIAISTSGEDLSAPVDTRFGRAPRFLIYHMETGTFSLKENKQNLNAAQGAGIQSAACVCEEQVDAVITGNCGPKAFAVLDAAGIKVYTCGSTAISEAIDQLRQGQLHPADEANVEGHWV
ncbi:NifB/NifX family molybdenum-iron cluster-binding protein [Pontiella agarivorans]|uniref:NifB/NifX family molybdenum-iron cluster-binding protein n=1 Tax=Pontiella agarivorans TaxID=3038953 RepID=A0ABU5MV32_9BACT|nr:NifB/NifX family molybdenum-iron cluster-binding protein [Pontiella agarivorans]MDZ8118003.1 NifB/NifX family molybdenum-iron cluster-binding protein [Pontiella agarivorans]